MSFNRLLQFLQLQAGFFFSVKLYFLLQFIVIPTASDCCFVFFFCFFFSIKLLLSTVYCNPTDLDWLFSEAMPLKSLLQFLQLQICYSVKQCPSIGYYNSYSFRLFVCFFFLSFSVKLFPSTVPAALDWLFSKAFSFYRLLQVQNTSAQFVKHLLNNLQKSSYSLKIIPIFAHMHQKIDFVMTLNKSQKQIFTNFLENWIRKKTNAIEFC